MKTSGSSGCDRPCFPARLRELFHSATSLPGTQGGSRATSDSGSFAPVSSAPANMSPEWTATVSPSRVPKPATPSFSKRTHWAMAFSLRGSVPRLPSRRVRRQPRRSDLQRAFLDARRLRRRLALRDQVVPVDVPILIVEEAHRLEARRVVRSGARRERIGRGIPGRVEEERDRIPFGPGWHHAVRRGEEAPVGPAVQELARVPEDWAL